MPVRDTARILVADDDEIIRQLCARALSKVGCHVMTVCDGLEVLSSVQQHDFDLILMDYWMKNMDGDEVAKRLRDGGDTHERIPIVIITSSEKVEELSQKLDHGWMVDFIKKPIHLSELYGVVGKYVELSSEAQMHVKKTERGFEVVDISVLDEIKLLSGGKGNIVREFIDLFLHETLSKLEKMGKSLEMANKEEFSRLAHALRSGAGTAGAMEMAQICEEFEADQEEKTEKACQQAYENLRKSFLNTEKELLKIRPVDKPLDEEYFVPAPIEHQKREKAKARELRQSQWWKGQLGKGLCYHCGDRFHSGDLTMDHLVPIVRGGRSHRKNCVPSCKECNSKKGYKTRLELALAKVSSNSNAD